LAIARDPEKINVNSSRRPVSVKVGLAKTCWIRFTMKTKDIAAKVEKRAKCVFGFIVLASDASG